MLYTIEGLPSAQLKNVQFIFLPLENDGMFEISARFMGVDMERVTVDIQVDTVVVGVYFNTMKTTFDLNFSFSKISKSKETHKHGYKQKQFLFVYLLTCNLTKAC